jgi:ATPase family AAA domain-containing protein 1
MSRSGNTQKDWLAVGEMAIGMAISVYLGYKLVNLGERSLKQMEDMKGGVNDAQQAAVRKTLAERLNRPDLGDLQLNSYEVRLSAEVVATSELGVGFSDIGGMDEEVVEVRDNVVLPMQCWRQFGPKAAEMMTCPTGVLLYGRPGTGKTLTAMALASESGAAFLAVKSSDLMDKWLGESDKLVSAVFSLARKIAPTIVFIDEVDTLMRKRENDQNGAVTSMQGILLTEWDGLKVGNTTSAPVVVLGATNRPHDLDRAILRRMPVQVKTPMPNLQGRLDILNKLLRHSGVYNEEQEGGLDGDVDLQEIALRTEDYSGSDLREVVRVALLQRTKRSLSEASREQQVAKAKYESNVDKWKALGKPAAKDGTSGEPVMKSILPKKKKVMLQDFNYSLTKALATGAAASNYARELNLEGLY